MKKSNFIFTVIFIWIVISFCSCSESETEMKQEKVFPTSFELIKNQKLREAGIFTPSVVSIKGDQAVIGFLPSTRIYSILLTDEVSRSCVDFLQKAIKERKPLKVFTLQNSNEICKIEQLSEEEEKKYAPVTTPKIKSRVSLERYISDWGIIEEISDICRLSIYYDYSGDGCFARAHKMRQIINDLGYDCDKIFIFGEYGLGGTYYRAQSLAEYNHVGDCCSYWSYHVVPVLYYGTAQSHTPVIIAPNITPEGEWMGSCMDNRCFPFTDMYGLHINNAKASGICIEPGNVFHLETHARNAQSVRYYDDNYTTTDYVLNLCEGKIGCDEL